jgi:hypothetical protein
MRYTAQEIERTIPLPAVRRALSMKDNRTLKAACLRHGVPIISFSPRAKALRESDYARLLERASGA